MSVKNPHPFYQVASVKITFVCSVINFTVAKFNSFYQQRHVRLCKYVFRENHQLCYGNIIPQVAQQVAGEYTCNYTAIILAIL
jgi:hypothetical protein